MNRSAWSSSGIGLVIVPDEDEELVEISTKDPLEKALLNFYKGKVTQSSTSPFMQEPLLSFIGSMGITNYVEQVIKGNAYIPEDISLEMVEVMKCLALKKGTSLHYQPAPITVEAAMNGSNGW